MLKLEEYAAIIERAPVLIWRADNTGACDYFNERWLQFRGRTIEEELGEGWTEGVHPEDRASCIETWKMHFKARTSFNIDYRLRRHDGAYRWIHDSGAPVYLPNGEFAGFVGSCVEFTLLLAHSSEEVQRELKSLRGLISLCSWCHRVEDQQGNWVAIENYLSACSSLGFTHGICPHCVAHQAAEA